MTTGEKVRALREKHGDTLEELAKKIGIQSSGLSKIERDAVKTSEERLRAIADVYDVDPFEIFFEELAPPELRELGLRRFGLAKEMQEREFSEEEIKAAMEIVLKFRKLK